MIETQIEQIYTNCLAQGSYFIESEGEAIVIDPLRETFPYLNRASERGVKIKYIFETHFHADFVSGHLDLAKKTGASIVYGPNAETSFEKISAEDGQIFNFGKLSIKVLHTPGHTPESSTFLLLDENGKEVSIFTGDTLFISDVGRPDLAQKATNLSKEDLAGWMFDSLRNKIMPLPDHVMVYPAHGAGSACGKNMSSETFDTLGNQKKTNYALRADMTKEEFIKELTHGLMAPPQYFSKNAKLNKMGYGAIDHVMETGLKALNVADIELLQQQEDVLLLDVRDKWDFVKGYVPGSVFIGLDGSFAPWVGALIEDLNQKIVVIAPTGREEEAVRRLARVGYDNTIGYLKGGFEIWSNAGKKIKQIETLNIDTFAEFYINHPKIPVIDIRKPGEFESSHLTSAVNKPLDFIHDWLSSFDPSEKTYLHCRSGYRSTVASSLLSKHGKSNVVNVIGSFDDFKETKLSMCTAETACGS